MKKRLNSWKRLPEVEDFLIGLSVKWNLESLCFLEKLHGGKILKNSSDIQTFSWVILFSNFRLYDTYGFPVDLTQLMAEERGMSVDEEGYKNAEKEAKETSKGKSAGVEDTISLDVHAINELNEKGFNPTDDSIKYNYKALTEEKNAEYNFDNCTRYLDI